MNAAQNPSGGWTRTHAETASEREDIAEPDRRTPRTGTAARSEDGAGTGKPEHEARRVEGVRRAQTVASGRARRRTLRESRTRKGADGGAARRLRVRRGGHRRTDRALRTLTLRHAAPSTGRPHRQGGSPAPSIPPHSHRRDEAPGAPTQPPSPTPNPPELPGTRLKGGLVRVLHSRPRGKDDGDSPSLSRLEAAAARGRGSTRYAPNRPATDGRAHPPLRLPRTPPHGHPSTSRRK